MLRSSKDQLTFPFIREVQISGPAARSSKKEMRPGRAFYVARVGLPGLTSGSWKVITMHYVLAVGLHAVCERCRIRCWAHQISCNARLGSGSAFGDILHLHIISNPLPSIADGSAGLAKLLRANEIRFFGLVRIDRTVLTNSFHRKAVE